MARIDRYLLREIVVPLCISVAMVVLAVFLIQARRLATAALGLGLTFTDAAVIFASALPPFLMMAVPIAYLMSVLIGMGRLSGDLELLVLRAAGASSWRVARTPLLLGLLVSALALPASLWGEPFGLSVLHERLVDVGLRNLTHAIRPGVFNEDFRGSAIYARARREDGALLGVLLYDERDRERPVLLAAREGRLNAERGAAVVVELADGEMHLASASSSTSYERISFARARLGMDAEQDLTRKTAFVSIIGRLSQQEMREEISRYGADSELGRRIEKMYWRRYAFPLMSFVFGLVAAAITLSGGPRARARNAMLGIASVLGYYVLTRIGDFVVVQYAGTPFWMAAGPNLLVLALGAAALHRAGRPR